MKDRIYSDIYTLPVQRKGTPVSNAKVFFDGVPAIRDRTVVAMSVSYYISNPGFVDQIFITLVDKKGDILLWNYPLFDLMDTTQNQIGVVAVLNQRLRLFDLKDIEFQNSYYFFTDVSALVRDPLFNINFYLK